jgi:hypothetical protein
MGMYYFIRFKKLVEGQKMKKMKMLKRIISGAGLMAALFSLPSCLKNGAYYIPFQDAAASVDLPLAASTGNGVTSFNYPPTVTTVTLPVYFNVASPSLPTAPVTGTLSLDTAGLNAYNTANGTAFTPLPDSVYTVSGWTVTVPAGQRLDSINVTINLAKMDLSGAYVLPITIASASLPIEQWNHLFYYIAVKNQFDGHYTVTGSFVDHTNAAFTSAYPMDIDLITSGPNSVDVFNTALGFVGYEFLNAGTATYYGDFGVRIFIDPTTNAVTSVINTAGQPAPNTRSAVLDPSGINMYDPSTGNISLSYFMTQPSAVPAPPNIRSNFTEVYTYLGSR